MLNSLELVDFVNKWRNFKRTKIYRIQEPAENIKPSEHFDVNLYFEVFDKLKMKENYVLDWIYYKNFMGGAPIIYSRKNDEPSINNNIQIKQYQYLPFLDFEKTEIGYLQIALFIATAERFALFWHAQYGSYKFIFNKQEIIDVLKKYSIILDKKEEEILSNLNPVPDILIRKNITIVKLFCFEYIQHGFYLYYFIFKDGKFRKEKIIEVIEDKNPIMF